MGDEFKPLWTDRQFGQPPLKIDKQPITEEMVMARWLDESGAGPNPNFTHVSCATDGCEGQIWWPNEKPMPKEPRCYVCERDGVL